MKQKFLFTLLISLLLFISLLPFFDVLTASWLDDALKRAFISFGLAKALNAIISLLQGTELSLMPAGIGVTLSLGEVLDPLNDMVERFSWIMFASTISLGILKILFLLTKQLFFKIILGAIGMILFLLLWIWPKQQKLFLYLFKVFFTLTLLKILFSVTLMSANFIHYTVLDKEYKNSTLQIEQTQKVLQDFEKSSKEEVKTQKEHSIVDYFKEKYTQVKSSLNLQQRFENLQQRVDQAYNDLINLATIFIFETIIVPLLFLWIFRKVIQTIYRKNSISIT